MAKQDISTKIKVKSFAHEGEKKLVIGFNQRTFFIECPPEKVEGFKAGVLEMFKEYEEELLYELFGRIH